MINYQIIQDSIKHYESREFKRIESPWTVTEAISNITKPKDANNWTIKEKKKVLVASGEQSFLYLYNKGFLPKGKFQTITPCFRDESFDEMHTKYFIKNELIATYNVNQYTVGLMVCAAIDFFSKYLPSKYIEHRRISSDQYDIFYKDIELGSYGIRECDFLRWAYGTAVAEPRLTRTMKKYGLS